MSDEVKRDAKGRVVSGTLHKATIGNRAKRVSRRLRAEYVRRYANMKLEGTDEVLGPDRAQLMHYFTLMSIMTNGGEKAADRIKASVELANRMDGKPVETVQLDAVTEHRSPLDEVVKDMTPEQLLELARAIRDRK